MIKCNSFSVLLVLLFFPFFVFGQVFEEISIQSGLSSERNNNGVAVADYDSDGDLDVFVVSRWDVSDPAVAESKLFRNENDGTFSDVTSQSGIQSAHNYQGLTIPSSAYGNFDFGSKMSAHWGDYDNDGFVDLLLVNLFFYELYRNNGNGTFTSVIEESGLPESNECYNTGALWFDYDNDTFLDIYFTRLYECDGGVLFRNNGDGSFQDVTDSLGLNGSGPQGWMAIPWDINGDGFQDVYVANDFDLPNELFINNAAQNFSESASSYGISDVGKDGMCVTLSDYNMDGYSDLFVTNINQSSLYKGVEEETFIDVAGNLGLMRTDWAWGAQFADFDHDLDEDVIILNGFEDYQTADFYFQNRLETGEERFDDVSSLLGFNEIKFSNSLAVFDFDNDGDQDVLISRTGDQLSFLENFTIDHDSLAEKNWLKISLIGTSVNRDAIGAKVETIVNDESIIRHVHGSSFMAQSKVPVHVGIGAYERVDQINITWPNGAEEILNEIPINTYIEVTQGEGYKILDFKAEKISGCNDPAACNYNSSATQNDGSCVYQKESIIEGPEEADILTIQTYTYFDDQSDSFSWSVENGELIEGQGTNQVSVKWGISNSGKVKVIGKGACESPEQELRVALLFQEESNTTSIARFWNEILLEAIRNDFARPTVHARNLFHVSAAMYDAWAVLTGNNTYLLGKTVHGINTPFSGFETDETAAEALNKAISYAAFRLLSHRFKNSPNAELTLAKLNESMNLLGYDHGFTTTAFADGDPASLGNFIAASYISFGMADGAREATGYDNEYYTPLNQSIAPFIPGNPTISDPNRWQELELDVFIDQAGNPIPGLVAEFLSPEWGNVLPFSLTDSDRTTYTRDGHSYSVYLDPGVPPYLNGTSIEHSIADLYKWNFSMVPVWSSHLDPSDGVMWDISPASIGNIAFEDLPESLENHPDFYNLFDGGDSGKGHLLNPISGMPYEPQIVPRGDYTRVLAEFWADGPDSETPPGHWFVLLNYVSDHPDFVPKWAGKGQELSNLEWDIRSYFTLSGAMHDAAICAWSAKGYYDYIRPLSAVRYMADQGQSTNPNLENYNPNGIPLIEGYIEVVAKGDPLAGDDNQNAGKIKLLSWLGHSEVNVDNSNTAGVDWILAENWWPYQRPSFVTPPFAGYVSGHSTFSRAAAEVLTLMTGSPYFPGGMGEFVAKKNDFLVFEQGPSQDVVLQWATYRDASDQCSLSRIWGGIHPPADDIPGRIIGEKVGKEAFNFAEAIFNGTNLLSLGNRDRLVYPNPSLGAFIMTSTKAEQVFKLYDLAGSAVEIKSIQYSEESRQHKIEVGPVLPGLYFMHTDGEVFKVLIE